MLVHLLGKIGYAILPYNFNLIQRVSFYLAQNAINKSLEVSEVFLKKILELDLRDWGYQFASIITLKLDPLEDDVSSDKWRKKRGPVEANSLYNIKSVFA